MKKLSMILIAATIPTVASAVSTGWFSPSEYLPDGFTTEWRQALAVAKQELHRPFHRNFEVITREVICARKDRWTLVAKSDHLSMITTILKAPGGYQVRVGTDEALSEVSTVGCKAIPNR